MKRGRPLPIIVTRDPRSFRYRYFSLFFFLSLPYSFFLIPFFKSFFLYRLSSVSTSRVHGTKLERIGRESTKQPSALEDGNPRSNAEWDYSLRIRKLVLIEIVSSKKLIRGVFQTFYWFYNCLIGFRFGVSRYSKRGRSFVCIAAICFYLISLALSRADGPRFPDFFYEAS